MVWSLDARLAQGFSYQEGLNQGGKIPVQNNDVHRDTSLASPLASLEIEFDRKQSR